MACCWTGTTCLSFPINPSSQVSRILRLHAHNMSLCPKMFKMLPTYSLWIFFEVSCWVTLCLFPRMVCKSSLGQLHQEPFFLLLSVHLLCPPVVFLLWLLTSVGCLWTVLRLLSLRVQKYLYSAPWQDWPAVALGCALLRGCEEKTPSPVCVTEEKSWANLLLTPVLFFLLAKFFFLPDFELRHQATSAQTPAWYLMKVLLPTKPCASGHLQWFSEIISLPASSVFTPPRAPRRRSVTPCCGPAVLPLLFCHLFHFPFSFAVCVKRFAHF